MKPWISPLVHLAAIVAAFTVLSVPTAIAVVLGYVSLRLALYLFPIMRFMCRLAKVARERGYDTARIAAGIGNFERFLNAYLDQEPEDLLEELDEWADKSDPAAAVEEFIYPAPAPRIMPRSAIFDMLARSIERSREATRREFPGIFPAERMRDPWTLDIDSLPMPTRSLSYGEELQALADTIEAGDPVVIYVDRQGNATTDLEALDYVGRGWEVTKPAPVELASTPKPIVFGTVAHYPIQRQVYAGDQLRAVGDGRPWTSDPDRSPWLAIQDREAA